MVKNVIDVIFGGLSYWMFGFGFTFGEKWPNPFIGFGNFFFDPEHSDPTEEAWSYASFLFQMSFATTTSTIVSAAMAERIRLKSYIVITFVLTLIHSVSAHWVWSPFGIFRRMGVVDAAGCSAVHLVGGIAGLSATFYLGPRSNRFGEKGSKQMSNPTNAVLGTFMLWWGWLAFNTGSTYGISEGRWRLAARSAVATILSSVGGGCTSIVISMIATKKCQVDLLIDGLLASLVSTTAICLCVTPWQSIIIGCIGSALAIATYPLVERLEIDDPVGVLPVHVVASTWGMLCVGIFARHDPEQVDLTMGYSGILYGGGFYLLGIQALTVIAIVVWSTITCLICISALSRSCWGVRMTKYEEQIGADLIEHGLAGHNIARYAVEKKLTTKFVNSFYFA
uniref:Ammonium transporter AmtB-like domain-containing protein n=1 Tax=Ascaris lumbricoides TaxID=6252 RepID=A0A9J2Q1B7_ASCLU